MKKRHKVILLVLSSQLALSIFLVGGMSTINYLQLNNAKQGCNEISGVSTVETSYLFLQTSYSCNQS